MNLRVMIPAFLLLILQAFAVARTQFDAGRMQRDLEIMEGVLSKMLSRYTAGAGLSGNPTSSVYIDGYGAVMVVNIAPDFFVHLDHQGRDVNIIIRDEKNIVRVGPKGSSAQVLGRDMDDRDAKANTVKIKAEVVEFLTDYAPAIGQLQSSDYVTIIIGFSRYSHAFRFKTQASGSTDSPSRIHFSVLKSDLETFRKEHYSASQFRDRIDIVEKYERPGAEQEIDIMANILETALDNRRQPGLFDDNKSLYIEGLGALFFLDGGLFFGNEPFQIDRYFEWHFGKDTVRQAETTTIPESVTDYNDLKETITSLVGAYGHTVKRLQETEKIIVAVDLGSTMQPAQWQKIPRKLLIQVARKDLDAHNRSRINMEQLKEKMEFTEFWGK